MEAKKDNQKYGELIDSWQVHEYIKHERPKSWYLVAAVVAGCLILFSFFTGNFLFAVIIILAALVIILNHGQNPKLVDVGIGNEGLIVGKNFYDYDEIKNFSIVYKPRINVGNIYLEFNSFLKHRLTIPLENKNPVGVRNNLLKFIPENLERTDEPVSESLAKLFKL